MNGILLFLALVLIAIVLKFLFDTYLTNNTAKRWDDYKSREPEKAARIINNKGLDVSTKSKSTNTNKIVGVALIAKKLNCHPSEAKSYFLKGIKSSGLTLSQVNEVIKGLRENIYKEAIHLIIDPEDTPAAIKIKWLESYIGDILEDELNWGNKNHNKRFVGSENSTSSKLNSTIGEKYATLINILTESPAGNILKDTSNEALISIREHPSSIIMIYLKETYDKLYVKLNVEISSKVVERKQWRFPLGTSQEDIFERIVPNITIDDIPDNSGTNSTCPFIGKYFYSDYGYMLDLNNNEPTSHSSSQVHYEPHQDKIITRYVDDLSTSTKDVHLAWDFLRKEDDKYIFKDERDDIWTLSRNKFTKTTYDENKLYVREVDEV